MKPSSIDVEKFEMLYNAGLSPGEIAEQFGVEYRYLYSWMTYRGYPRFCPEHQKIIRQMCDDGATDTEIAKRVNAGVSAVVVWREKNKLKKKSYRGKVGVENAYRE